MAITASNMRDASTRFRALVVFTVLGLLLGVAIGLQIEIGKLDQEEREHVTAYAAGRAFTAIGLTGLGGSHEPFFLTTYRTIRQKFPASADAMEAATSRALWFPWPLIGVLMGFGLMAIYSKFLAFSKGTTE
jgi:hypothetical protein